MPNGRDRRQEIIPSPFVWLVHLISTFVFNSFPTDVNPANLARRTGGKVSTWTMKLSDHEEVRSQVGMSPGEWCQSKVHLPYSHILHVFNLFYPFRMSPRFPGLPSRRQLSNLALENENESLHCYHRHIWTADSTIPYYLVECACFLGGTSRRLLPHYARIPHSNYSNYVVFLFRCTVLHYVASSIPIWAGPQPKAPKRIKAEGQKSQNY